MNPTIRDKWAAALEIGRFQQAKGALRRGDAYCCLGVLCEVFRQETGEGEWRHLEDSTDEYIFDGPRMRGHLHLPLPVVEWAGLSDTNPRLKDDASGYAAYLNDNLLSFPEIASLIRQLPGAGRGDTDHS